MQTYVRTICLSNECLTMHLFSGSYNKCWAAYRNLSATFQHVQHLSGSLTVLLGDLSKFAPSGSLPEPLGNLPTLTTLPGQPAGASRRPSHDYLPACGLCLWAIQPCKCLAGCDSLKCECERMCLCLCLCVCMYVCM